MDDERTQRIRDAAYLLWERAGRPDGGADEFWYEAERMIAEGREPQALREEGPRFVEEAPGSDPADLPEPAGTTSVPPTRRRATRGSPG